MPDFRILRHLAATVAMILLAAAPAGLVAQEPSRQAELDRFQASLDSLVPALLDELSTPGAAVAVLRDGQVALAKGYGWANREKRQPVTTSTLFNIGSISKTHAAWGLLRLVEDGKLDLDTPVEHYLTRWHLPPSAFDHDKVTLRRLLSHTAGLRLHGYPGFKPDESLPTIEESLSGNTNGSGDVRVIMEPGTRWQYSGGGYTIAQLLVEEVTGRPFADYMHDAVFAPLGMTSSSYLWNAMVDARAAQPYGAVAPIPGPRFTAQAAASLETSLEDFIRFARASMSSERPEFATTVLPPATVRAMQQPVAPSNDYGLGYSVHAVNGVRALGHGGSNAGWQAQFLVIPATGDGIILMTNASLGHEILNQVLCGWLRAAMGETRRCVKGIGAVIAGTVARAGVRDAVAGYRRLKAADPADYDFREPQLNSLGYALIVEGRLADAIAVFELNVEAYPEGYNAYDSLGEALLARGDTVSAIRNYEKSVQLNAQNQNGIDVLKRIKGPPE